VLHLVGLGRAGEHHLVAAVLQVGDQVAGALERLDLLDQRHVERFLGPPDVLALVLLDLVAAERIDEVVAAHADVAVDAPDRQQLAVLAEGAVPGDRVVVVGVDERSVDVEDGGHGHECDVPLLQTSATAATANRHRLSAEHSREWFAASRFRAPSPCWP
jgi:hypothetical protein